MKKFNIVLFFGMMAVFGTKTNIIISLLHLALFWKVRCGSLKRLVNLGNFLPARKKIFPLIWLMAGSLLED
ncbi:MAG TPA: hypothetical protein DDX11_01905 [Candidatus Peribacter riflensis]|nr:hypothetical protein [Candidatus Peribacter riflensis]